MHQVGTWDIHVRGLVAQRKKGKKRKAKRRQHQQIATGGIGKQSIHSTSIAKINKNKNK